jgi:hypothetical protein
MKECADYLCDLLVSEARRVSSEAGTSDVRKPAGPAAVLTTPRAGSSGLRDPAPDLSPHERWAIGQFDTRRWHLYERHRDGYRWLREILFEDRPQSALLLEELFRGKGSMTFMEAYAAMAKMRIDPDRAVRLARLGIDEDKIRKRVKSGVSHMNRELRANMRTVNKIKLTEYERGTARYRFLPRIGASVPRFEGEDRRFGEYKFMPY